MFNFFKKKVFKKRKQVLINNFTRLVTKAERKYALKYEDIKPKKLKIKKEK